jgi:hypothetical protein
MSWSLWLTERAWDNEGLEPEDEVGCVARGEDGGRETGRLDVGLNGPVETIRLTAGDGV